MDCVAGMVVDWRLGDRDGSGGVDLAIALATRAGHGCLGRQSGGNLHPDVWTIPHLDSFCAAIACDRLRGGRSDGFASNPPPTQSLGPVAVQVPIHAY